MGANPFICSAIKDFRTLRAIVPHLGQTSASPAAILINFVDAWLHSLRIANYFALTSAPPGVDLKVALVCTSIPNS